mgnify:CR=1 FL=1
MEFETAKKEIKTKYKTNTITNDVEQIFIPKLLDEYNLYFIVLKNSSKGAYLTDYAKNCETLNITTQKSEEIAKEFNINCKENCLFTNYNSLNDLNNFIKCLDKLSK